MSPARSICLTTSGTPEKAGQKQTQRPLIATHTFVTSLAAAAVEFAANGYSVMEMDGGSSMDRK
jgi:hypothetical protein